MAPIAEFNKYSESDGGVGQIRPCRFSAHGVTLPSVLLPINPPFPPYTLRQNTDNRPTAIVESLDCGVYAIPLIRPGFHACVVVWRSAPSWPPHEGCDERDK